MKIMKHMIFIIAIITGAIVSVTWSSYDNVSFGEAGCAGLLTIILILVTAIFAKVFNIGEKKWNNHKN